LILINSTQVTIMEQFKKDKMLNTLQVFFILMIAQTKERS